MLKHQRDEDEINHPESCICKGCVEFHPCEKSQWQNEWLKWKEKGGCEKDNHKDKTTHTKKE